MPRQRNPVGIATGKLILAIQKEQSGLTDDEDVAITRKILDRAHTLLQASRTSSVLSLLDGRSLHEYLGATWVAAHPSVQPSIDLLTTELRHNERE